MEIARAEVPLSQRDAAELAGLWNAVFGEPLAEFGPVLGGTECEHNRSTVFWAREAGRLAGACYLTLSRAVTSVGGLGGVAVLPQFRRRGMATALCEAARSEFHAQGGEALFLATSNPAAARIYHRLGWRKLAGANVWTCVSRRESPEEFLVRYFGQEAAPTVRTGGAAERITIIPLIVTPHDWHVLDVNAAILSTRYAVQASCMGLYPRYEGIFAGGAGSWFAACLPDGRTVGLATARIREPDAAVVDGFTHWRHARVWHNLIEAALAWAWSHGAQTARAFACVDDEEKQGLFGSMGFHVVGGAAELELTSARLPCRRLEKAA